jgi:hypothetical protein
MAHSPEVLFDDGANVVLRRGSCFVQVRAGAMTVQAVELLTALWRTMHQSVLTGETICGLFVLEAAAEVPPPEVRARQAVLFKELTKDERFRGALVIEGQDVRATLMRSMVRALWMGRGVRISATVNDAIRGLSATVGTQAHDLVDLVAEARRRLSERAAGR